MEEAEKLGFFDRLKVRDAVWRGRAVDDLRLAPAVRRLAEETEADAAIWSWRTSAGRRAFVRSYLAGSQGVWLVTLLLAAVNFWGYARNGDLLLLVSAVAFLFVTAHSAFVYAKRAPKAAAKARLANRSLFDS